MKENEIRHTIIMMFKDALGTVRSIRVPFARPDITGREVRQVMELIISLGRVLSRNGLPLVTMVKARLVTEKILFVASKNAIRPCPVREAQPISANKKNCTHRAHSSFTHALSHKFPFIGIAANALGKHLFCPFFSGKEGMIPVIPTFFFLRPRHVFPPGFQNLFQRLFQGLRYFFCGVMPPAQEMKPGAAAKGGTVQIPFDLRPHIQCQQMFQGMHATGGNGLHIGLGEAQVIV